MTTTPDFRALCAELLDELQYQTSNGTAAELQDRAHAALATPTPGPPTDEELDELWDKEAGYFNLYGEARCFARAVLERWGQ